MTSGLRYGVEVRSAQAADAPELTRLLGAGVAARHVAERLEAIRTHGAAAVLVATGYSGLSGFVTLDWAPVLQQARLVARITTLVVDLEERRRGIGRLLLKAASQAARTAGCETIELTAAPEHEAARAFCAATGFVTRGTVAVRVLRKKG